MTTTRPTTARDLEDLRDLPSPIMAEANNQANNSMRDLKLLETGNRSDVTVTCGAKSWELHTLTLSSRSRFFENALTRHYQVRATRIVLTFYPSWLLPLFC